MDGDELELLYNIANELNIYDDTLEISVQAGSHALKIKGMAECMLQVCRQGKDRVQGGNSEETHRMSLAVMDAINQGNIGMRASTETGLIIGVEYAGREHLFALESIER
jgi:hypothetical protein